MRASDSHTLHVAFQDLVDGMYPTGAFPPQTQEVCRAILRDERTRADILPGWCVDFLAEFSPSARRWTYGSAARRLLALTKRAQP